MGMKNLNELALLYAVATMESLSNPNIEDPRPKSKDTYCKTCLYYPNKSYCKAKGKNIKPNTLSCNKYE
jgi:hypothetical protein